MLFYVESLLSRTIGAISLQKILCHSCHALRHCHHPPFDSFYRFWKDVLIACISKRICYFFSFYLSCQRSKKALSVKVKSLHTQNLEKWRNYFPCKTFIDKAIKFNRSFVLWQLLLKATGSIYRILKSQKTTPAKNSTDIAIQFNRSFVLWQIPLKVLC